MAESPSPKAYCRVDGDRLWVRVALHEGGRAQLTGTVAADRNTGHAGVDVERMADTAPADVAKERAYRSKWKQALHLR